MSAESSDASIYGCFRTLPFTVLIGSALWSPCSQMIRRERQRHAKATNTSGMTALKYNAENWVQLSNMTLAAMPRAAKEYDKQKPASQVQRSEQYLKRLRAQQQANKAELEAQPQRLYYHDSCEYPIEDHLEVREISGRTKESCVQWSRYRLKGWKEIHK